MIIGDKVKVIKNSIYCKLQAAGRIENIAGNSKNKLFLIIFEDEKRFWLPENCLTQYDVGKCNHPLTKIFK